MRCLPITSFFIHSFIYTKCFVYIYIYESLINLLLFWRTLSDIADNNARSQFGDMTVRRISTNWWCTHAISHTVCVYTFVFVEWFLVWWELVTHYVDQNLYDRNGEQVFETGCLAVSEW